MKQSASSILQAAIAAFIKLLDKAASRKWSVWIVATHMTYIHLLDPQSWLLISLILMGVQGALDWKSLPTSTTLFHRGGETRKTESTNNTN